MIALFVLPGCSKTYDKIDQVIYPDIFKIDQDEYYVFVYRPQCTVCPQIEEDVYNYAKEAKHKKKMPNLYVLNKGDTVINGGIASDDYVDFVGATSYTEIKTSTSPFLILIKNGVVIKAIDTKTEIVIELQSRGA